jgi:DNA-binding NarL/FixJ family response regulator
MPATLLIVDDHAGFRMFARTLLEAGGLVVVGEAGDGATAIAEAGRLDPDVVLLDVILPDIDGFEVCERLVGGGIDRPAVVLTSSRDAASYRDRLAATAARGFLAKEALSARAILHLAGHR